MIKLVIERISQDAKLPTKTYNDRNGYYDLGWDLYASESITVNPFSVGIIKTGIKIRCPHDYGVIIKDRSSGSSKYEVVGGVYDPSFRGEICVNIHNYKNESITIDKGAKFAQFIIIPNIYSVIEEGEVISDTPRGEQCLGSTGS